MCGRRIDNKGHIRHVVIVGSVSNIIERAPRAVKVARDCGNPICGYSKEGEKSSVF